MQVALHKENEDGRVPNDMFCFHELKPSGILSPMHENAEYNHIQTHPKPLFNFVF